jgi:hypothetical protein
MTKATHNVARVAAAVAGFGLVASAFAPLAFAQTATTTTTTTTTSASFTRDLTIGSTGADVTALQTWLISKGYSIPAGATGYFGAQTQAALAAYQAANAITPAAGYFGPITRAKVAGSTGGTTTTTGGTTTTSTTLSGGEADLRSYDIRSGDDLREGDEDSEIASVKFDVDGGDVDVQRVTLDFQPTVAAASSNQHPWEYIDSLSVYSGDKKIGDVDAGSKSDWDQEDDDNDHSAAYDYYTIDIPVDGVIKEGDSADLSIRADAQSSIDDDDQDQVFKVQIPEDGIRAVDAAGIQQYVGNGDEVSLGFDAEESGDLTVRESSDNPDASVLVADEDDTSDEFDVLAFEIKNKDDADVDFNELSFDVAHGTHDATDLIRRATLTLDGDEYDGDVSANSIDFDDLDTSVDGNDTIDGTLSVELYGQSGHYDPTGEYITVSLDGDAASVDAESADSGDSSDVTGGASGNKQSISVDAGLQVDGTSNSTSLVTNDDEDTDNGNFTIKFDVTADGDDVFIPKAVASSTSSTTAGVVYTDDLSNPFPGNASKASLSVSGDYELVTGTGGQSYRISDGDTATFTLSVNLNPSTGNGNFYQVGLDQIRYSSSTNVSAGSLQTLDIDETDSDFQTDPLNIPS